ncbi:hypothetical protein LEP1GSC128_3756 [Leptospira borgpetersenii str. 200801926]|uniref:Uncharacterized protein n=2 Tax=Leptospira borgpetersenii TaxID=174 RepID=A0ABN0HVJ3_LEPBO|nr:hypothetical protein LEP1GSC128_3756 [Leptospira borgpetersenii str. 200801926]EMK10610.1 hypothetical protein LEP1GSC066_2358 [Leptospira sp. serovar Kenya str. Sh9]EMN16772.1 hypothetical protein LEP1GSC056_2604 [Leptospira borgpetersenii str. Brem 328]EMN57407.1 hypothetical protein LEP1GSC090_2491 [Leptospira borgpetersenii serovar Javanica str. MK146]
MRLHATFWFDSRFLIGNLAGFSSLRKQLTPRTIYRRNWEILEFFFLVRNFLKR